MLQIEVRNVGSILTLERTVGKQTQITGSYTKGSFTVENLSGEASLESTEAFNPDNKKLSDVCPLAFVVRWPSNGEDYRDTVMTYTGRYTVPVNGKTPYIRTVINTVATKQDDIRSVGVSLTKFKKKVD